ncbi:MAG TPA: methyltransferase domain-containing protein [Geobacteraceae bacterium]
MARKLHIGGTAATPGWEVLNIVPGPHVDHQGNAKDLSRFPEGTFNEIYASHVVEHFDYKDELLAALREWNRVLKPFGRLYVSVPDLDALAALFADRERLTPDDRFHVMRMMFGGHGDAHDYHLVGLNEEFLREYLRQAGFGGIRRVEGFGMFQDTSGMTFKEVPISLNLVAKKLADIGSDMP